MCARMDWNHLPVEGGLYNQHPELLEQWQVVWEEKAKYEAEKERKRKNSPKNVKGK